jgi:hypothetical protein
MRTSGNQLFKKIEKLFLLIVNFILILDVERGEEQGLSDK